MEVSRPPSRPPDSLALLFRGLSRLVVSSCLSLVSVLFSVPPGTPLDQVFVHCRDSLLVVLGEDFRATAPGMLVGFGRLGCTLCPTHIALCTGLGTQSSHVSQDIMVGSQHRLVGAAVVACDRTLARCFGPHCQIDRRGQCTRFDGGGHLIGTEGKSKLSKHGEPSVLSGKYQMSNISGNSWRLV